MMPDDDEPRKPRIPDVAGSCGIWTFFFAFAKPDPTPKELIPEAHQILLWGTPARNARQSCTYLWVGLPMLAMGILGFLPVIYRRLVDGVWWRDPVITRWSRMPDGLDLPLSMHGFIGLSWAVLITTQLVTGAACPVASESNGPLRRALRATHCWVGQRSVAVTALFFATCGWTWIQGVRAEPLGQGFNSIFVRLVQFTVAWTSWGCYLLGMYHAYHKNTAIHKDVMIGAILFATVPTGVPRFLRDFAQWFVGERCNVTGEVEFNFLICALLCVVGWPALFLLASRWMKVMKFWLIINIVVVLLCVLVTKPKLHMNECILSIANMSS